MSTKFDRRSTVIVYVSGRMNGDVRHASSPESRRRFPPMGGRGETLLHLRRLGRATLSRSWRTRWASARSTVGERTRAPDATRPGHDRRASRSTVSGRPATRFAFDPAGGRILTAQVGMTGVRLGVSDLAGDLVAHRLVEVAITGGVDIVLACDGAGLRGPPRRGRVAGRADRRRGHRPARGSRAVVPRGRPAGVGRAVDRHPALGDLRRADVRRSRRQPARPRSTLSRSCGRGIPAVRQGRFGDRLWLRWSTAGSLPAPTAWPARSGTPGYRTTTTAAPAVAADA